MAEETVYVTEARYGALQVRDRFRLSDASMRRGAECVLRTERGVETGVLTRDPAEVAAGEAPAGEVLRPMADEDRRRVAELAERGQGADFEFCVERIREHGLPMRLVHVEHLFGGGKVIFYFVSDGRVDFRELVKDLARHFQSRVELRQIGVRDEARILGDQEYCGNDLCCIRWMREILPVTMRMAKNQKSTLDPTKISGRCGRLKCCLRFEDEVYAELRGQLPRIGRRVVTPHGPGRVVAVDTLLGYATVELEDRLRVNCRSADLKPVETRPETPEEEEE
jgi:cell fate regulator YaaT (PSP1 superfamily)